MTCGHCNATAPSGVRFCPACGGELVLGPDIDPLAATALANPKELAAIRDAVTAGKTKAFEAKKDETSKAPGSVPKTMPLERVSTPGPRSAARPDADDARVSPLPHIPSRSPEESVRSAVTPAQASPPLSFVPGTRAFVRWSDGRQYPGVIEQTRDGSALVVFPDGQRHWVGFAFLTLAR